jgi:hypothetical protein
VEITWLGHGTFQFRLPSGETILMDPWTEGNPAYPQGYKIERVDTIAYYARAFRSHPRRGAPGEGVLTGRGGDLRDLSLARIPGRVEYAAHEQGRLAARPAR